MATAQRIDDGKSGRRPLGAEILDRRPPCNLEAERGVLGSIILLPEVCDEVALIIREKDFHDDANQKLFAHMMALHDAGRRIDMTLLVERLRSSGDFELIGGAAYLGELSRLRAACRQCRLLRRDRSR